LLACCWTWTWTDGCTWTDCHLGAYCLAILLIVVINFNVVACWTIGWLLDMDMECLLAALILCFGLFSFPFEGIIYLL
jgi:hypothetical protein